ncbi:MAG: aminopeptidase P family N-terminal domain-containing protein, partial [Bacteroidota bacterium]
MHNQKMDAFVSSFSPTVHYLCGYSGSNGLLIVTDRSVSFLTDFRYKEIIQTSVSADTKIIAS